MKYTNVTPDVTEKVRQLREKGKRVFIYGESGTHLVAWDIVGRGRTAHATTEKDLKRNDKLLIIKDPELARKAINIENSVLVVTFRAGNLYGISAVIL